MGHLKLFSIRYVFERANEFKATLLERSKFGARHNAQKRVELVSNSEADLIAVDKKEKKGG